MGRYIFSLFGAFLLLLALVGHAEAHANLVQSEPQAGASLPSAPKEIRLEFSEALDPAFSRVQLLNSNGQVVNPGPGMVDSTTLRLALSDLPKDSYTAVWRARSAVDGHITEGNLPFGVGVASSTVSLLPPVGAPDPALAPPPALESALRWLSLIAVALALGSMPFGMLVWRPALLAASARDCRAAANQSMTRTMRRLMLGGGAFLIMTSLLLLIEQAATAAQVSLIQAAGAPVAQLLSARTGQLTLIRIALAIMLMLVAWRLPPLSRAIDWRWWLALLLGGAVLLTWSLNSHSAAAEHNTALAVGADWLHMAAMVGWLGGLAPLVMVVSATRRTPERAVPLSVMIPRFSWLALACIALLTLTGLYSYVQNINQLSLLSATTYGRALLIKLGLFCLLILIGAANLLVLSPRMRATGKRFTREFTRNVRLELVIGAFVLLAVGAMTSVAPSTAAWAEHEQQGNVATAQVGDVRLTLRVAPAQIGDNEFGVDVVDPRPGAADTPAQVLLRFNSVAMDMGVLQADAKPDGAQRYVARGSYISMDGRWKIEVILRRAGFDDVRHTFEMSFG